MDFDPGELFDDDDGVDYTEYTGDAPEYEDDTDEVELAAAAGLGYHMAQEEIEERKIAADILRKRDKNQGKPEAIPLWKRHEAKGKGKMTPFGRWATMVNNDPARRKLDITYTKEEQLAILRAEAEGE